MIKRKFVLRSEKFKGEVLFEFTDSILTKYDTSDAELSEEQTMHLAKKLPRELADVKNWLAESHTSSFLEIIQEITFDLFWDRYDDKVNSSRKRSLIKWNKMSKNEQRKAFNYIQKYFMSIPFGTRKKYAETYLNAELWNN
jgi:hypothetical protein